MSNQFTHDAATIGFDSVTVDGVTVNEDDGVSFDWNEIPVVELDEPPHARAFDTNKFYKIADATVARPIKQPYYEDGEINWYKKPAEELRKLAWSLDNRPYTLEHPETGMVKDVADVHGFWKSPHYDDDEERLLEDLYVPTNDEDAIEFVENNTDVSIGFYNRVVSEYDGDTGDLTDDEGLDGYQVNMYGDHIAGVKHGRCSAEAGCGLDSHEHGEVITNAGEPDSMSDEYTITPSVDEFSLDFTDEDGKYFAVAPSENPDGEPKFPINNCSDVDDAWHFAIREQGDIDISFDTLKNRIQSRARSLDCDVPSESEQSNDSDNIMTDDNEFDIPDLSMDTLADKDERVAELREERDSFKSTVDEVEEELEEHGIDVDEYECPCDAIHDLAEQRDEYETKAEQRKSELDEYREEEKQAVLDELDSYVADIEEYEDESLDAVEEELERRKEIAEEIETDTKNVDTSGGNDGGSTGGIRRKPRGHAATPN